MVTPLYTYYERLFKDKDQLDVLYKNDLIKNHILKVGEVFSVKTKEFQPMHLEEILYDRKSISFDKENFLLKAFLKNHFSIMELLNNENKDYLESNISTLEIKDYIVNSFYDCLHNNSIDKNPKNKRFISHRQLIENVCVEERIMYFNFINDHNLMKKSDIKKYINKRYVEIILKSDEFPIVNYDKISLDELLAFYSNSDKKV